MKEIVITRKQVLSRNPGVYGRYMAWFKGKECLNCADLDEIEIDARFFILLVLLNMQQLQVLASDLAGYALRYIDDPRIINAIHVKRRWLLGMATDGELADCARGVYDVINGVKCNDMRDDAGDMGNLGKELIEAWGTPEDVYGVYVYCQSLGGGNPFAMGGSRTFENWAIGRILKIYKNEEGKK